MVNNSSEVLKYLLKIYRNIQKSETQDRTNPNINIMKKQSKNEVYMASSKKVGSCMGGVELYCRREKSPVGWRTAFVLILR
jgi:hypothetical protein